MRDVDPAGARYYAAAVNVTVRIPDELAERLTAEGADLERRALPALLADAGEQGGWRYVGSFVANICNPHTRRPTPALPTVLHLVRTSRTGACAI
jgi:hypothetical protein